MFIWVARIIMAILAIVVIFWIFQIIRAIRKDRVSPSMQAARDEQERLTEAEGKLAQRALNVQKYGLETVLGWEREHQTNLRIAETQRIAKEAELRELSWWKRHRPGKDASLLIFLIPFYIALSTIFALVGDIPLWPPKYLLGTLILVTICGLLPAIIAYATAHPRASFKIKLLDSMLVGLVLGLMLASLVLFAGTISESIPMGPLDMGPCNKGAPWNC